MWNKTFKNKGIKQQGGHMLISTPGRSLERLMTGWAMSRFIRLLAWPWGSWKIESLISFEVTASVWHHNSRNWKWNRPDTITEKWPLVQEPNLLGAWRGGGVCWWTRCQTGLSQMQDSANSSTSVNRERLIQKPGNCFFFFFLRIAEMKEENRNGSDYNRSRLRC